MGADPLAGTRYRILRFLAEGGMGEVFEAEHIALGRRVAIKLLHRRFKDRGDLADRMRLEGQALGRVYHPNVVEVLDLGTTREGRPFVVMERLVGCPLATELRDRGAIPATEAAVLGIQALAGLAAVHAEGLLHRDLKLDNLFLCDAGPGLPRRVKLLDLGVAKVIGGEGPAPLTVRTDEGVSMGTPRFFSPEQASGAPLDERSDLYAMGIVLYTLVAGRGPFDHLKRLADVLDAHVHALPAPPSHYASQPIPPALEGVILKALEKRPADRYPGLTELAAALKHAVMPIERDPGPSPGVNKARGNRWRWGGPSLAWRRDGT